MRMLFEYLDGKKNIELNYNTIDYKVCDYECTCMTV